MDLLKEKDGKRERALHTKRASDMYSKLIRLRIRMQKRLTEMNRWPTSSAAEDDYHKNARHNMEAALALLLPQVVSGTNVDFDEVEASLADSHSRRMSKCRELISEQYRRSVALSGGDSFHKFSQSPVELIDRTLQDHERLLKRTQMSRSGEKPCDVAANDDREAMLVDEMNSDEAIIKVAERERQMKKDKEKFSSEEIFDDQDFYEVLLHEFIRSQSADTGGEVRSKGSDLYNLKSSSRKVSSERASKGRKVRYTIFPKMVNVTHPNSVHVPAHEREEIFDEKKRESLYRSLFQ